MSNNELENFIRDVVSEIFADRHLANAIRGNGRHQLVKDILEAIENNGGLANLPMQVVHLF